ncbi:protein serine/threonine phosphatase with extracellular sensor [Pseudodesulfovibrio mercurii]|uniref:Protein serine/threonine phosphatase with extracellular sensor n=1 Tax=Pseudodesulfovibrio mercurii TaxID=641491 RepID=F0JGV6_9BACT|nr:PP2C family protein-serine/threonine phosphatase [Pseudodesulfovibrio mercurii]EGB15146.1 protein serine/threonine phosphatase with extracellular sensor [Pseudodesulfovibrio mercurii]
MRIQFKLLILLMSISLIPLLVVRTTIRRDLTKLGENLAERSENTLVHKASTGLQRIVEDHARVLKRERQLLEATAMLLASRIEGVLSGHSHMPEQGDFIPPDVSLDELGAAYFRMHMGGGQQLLKVDFSRVGVRGELPGFVLERLAPLIGTVKLEYPDLVLWTLVDLRGGSHIVYPRVDSTMHGMRGMTGPMDAPAPLRDSLTWTLPKVDPMTGRMAFEVVAPIRTAHGELQGNLTLVVPVDSILKENQHIGMFSTQAESMLVRPEKNAETGAVRVRVVASERKRTDAPGHWWAPQENVWLMSDDKMQFDIMTSRIVASRPGVVGMSFNGRSALWAFAPIDERGSVLLLIVPKSDIVRDAQAARDYVETQVERHSNTIGYVVLLAAVSALILSLLLSRVLTRNISALADAVRSVAKGNFDVRTAIRSRDEVGQLGLAFNRMIPELKERVNLKNALEVAQEVQQSLLPSESPAFPGVDVAATSSYCDETGGDYYGFIPRSTDAGDGLVVAVGDVSGHGMQAALLMASVRAYLRSQLHGGAGLDEAVTRVNELISDDVEGTGRFMTLFLLELVNGGARWVRAGHDPAMLYDPETDAFEDLQGDGLPLGVTHDVTFEVGSREDLRPGQCIVIGTDGIWEMQSESGEMFGKERLKEVIRQGVGDTSAQLIGRLVEALDAFRGNAGQLDDMTIAVVKIS